MFYLLRDAGEVYSLEVTRDHVRREKSSSCESPASAVFSLRPFLTRHSQGHAGTRGLTMSQDSTRGPFKPMRSRASIAAIPSSSTDGVDSRQTLTRRPSLAADTAPATAQSTRKKRAQSLGGDALDAARKRARGVEALRQDASANLTLELSPGKLERRRAVSRPAWCAWAG